MATSHVALALLALGGSHLLACGDKDGGQDGGQDGGTADGGTTDGGTGDGGTADGGTVDGGTADGGTTGDGGTATEGDCDDGTDDDGDGEVDCDDSDCALAAGCYEADCDDGVDDDSDGDIDCDDEDCLGNPYCPELDCDNGDDDDGDGWADCLDVDCLESPDCLAEADCANGTDDDEDGLVDCDDSDCALALGCYEADCTDDLDDDGDGYVDCVDGDCYRREGCIEDLCDDGVDNDEDGGIDCLDVDCHPTRPCMAECTEADAGAVAEGALYSGSTSGASDVFDDVDTCGGEGGPDAGIIYELPDTGCFVLSTEGSAFDTVLRTYESCEESDELACGDDTSEDDLTSRLYVSGEPGDLMVVVVDGYDSSASGDFELSVSPYVFPVEDDIGSVTGEAAWTGELDGTEDLDWLLSCAYSAAYDELLRWTAPSAGTWSFDTSASDFDTVLGVVSAGETCPTELGCNDDESYPDILTSLVEVELEADQEVILWVSGYDSSSVGDYQLDISLAR